MPTQIAIDGPAGTGKSTVAKLVAEQMQLPYLNTGQLYRAVAYLVVRVFRHDPVDAEFATKIALGLDPYIEGGVVVHANGYSMAGKLDGDDISKASSAVAKHPGVRDALIKVQQDFATRHGVVMEGRDIGTVILPSAEYKFFLVCDPEVRAQRRAFDGNVETVEELMARDRQDSERAAAPLIKADGAIEIDTTDISIQEVVALIINHVHGLIGESDQIKADRQFYDSRRGIW